MKFSERIGRSTPRSALQVESMDDALRNSLWNLLCDWYKPSRGPGGRARYRWPGVARAVARDFVKTPVDDLPDRNHACRALVKELFYQLPWYGIYDLIEFLVTENPGYARPRSELLPDLVNEILKREGSGYRFVSGELTPITSEGEIAAVSEAIEAAESLGLRAVGEHIRTALRHLRRKPDADYRNATKEAISAVESAVKLITGTRGGGLKDALDQLGEEAPIHGAFREGFLKLYGYTSDEDGVRHALLKESDLGFDEAKFMVVTCSAAAYFLIAKAEAAGMMSPPD